MLLWYAGLSVVIVYFVFQSAGVDYRLVAVGSLLPAAGIVVLEELAGLAACAWIAVRFGLTDRARRDDFLRTGRLRATTPS